MDVQLPDGRTVSIDTDDPQVAAAAAHKFQAANPRSMSDMLTGETGPRYQTWPERLARGVFQGVKELPSLPERALQSAGELQRTGDVYNPAPVLEAATLGMPVGASYRAGERFGAGAVGAKTVPVKTQAPTASELVGAGGRDIGAAKNSGLEIAPEALAEYGRKTQQGLFSGELTGSAIHPVDAPNTFLKLKELENVPGSASGRPLVTAANLQSLRESLQTTAQNFNPQAAKDQLAASLAIKELDKFIPSLAPKDVLAGTPAATQALFERGRGNYAAGMRSNNITGELDRAITGIGERADARAQAANSGRNIDNTIRSKVEGFLEKPKEVSGYNDAELAALERVREGGGFRNVSRYVGNLFGGGGGVGQSGIGIMGAMGGGLGFGAAGVPGAGVGAAVGGAIPVATGAIAKSVANALARRDLRAADELIRQRSPLFLERQQAAGLEGVPIADREAVLKALMLQQQQ